MQWKIIFHNRKYSFNNGLIMCLVIKSVKVFPKYLTIILKIKIGSVIQCCVNKKIFQIAGKCELLNLKQTLYCVTYI